MLKRLSTLHLIACALPVLLLSSAVAIPQSKTPPKPAATPDNFAKEVSPFVMKYCFGCHGGDKPQGDVSIGKERNTAEFLKNRKNWEAGIRAIAENRMPPPNMPQPTQAEREKIISWAESTLSKADCEINDPGRVTMRRLNREEYNNTIRDLLGVTKIQLGEGKQGRPADDFPNDDVGYGFDNIGDVLSLSPLLLERFLNVAEKISEVAIIAPEQTARPQNFSVAEMKATAGNVASEGRVLPTNGEIYTDYDAPRQGEYLLTVMAFADQAGEELAKMGIAVDGKTLQEFSIANGARSPRTVEVKLNLSAGKHKLAVAFLNDFYDPNNPNPRRRDRNLYVTKVQIMPPGGMPENLPASHKRIITAKPGENGLTPDQAARKVLRPIASRAFRRPVTEVELNKLAGYVKVASKEGDSFERGIQVALQSILISPHFLFRVEMDTDPKNPKAARLLNDYELASRLAYFLWSSIPDDELNQLAAAKKLNNPTVLAAQVKRMLADDKAKALAENFGMQWLTLRNLANVSPDPQRFPEYNAELRNLMRLETEYYFAYIVENDRSILEFIDADYALLNEKMAKHYGINTVKGDSFRKVTLTDGNRGGLVTQASVLTVTSNPTRTSPVKRGKWVLEAILGTPPPPAPPNVPLLADDKKEPLKGTLRQRMEQHRKDPTCASCHNSMDAIGFGLENFDPIGKWRTRDGEGNIDPSGTLPGGKSFNGAAQLKKILLARKAQFTKSFSEKLLTYALGRGLERYDNCKVSDISNYVTKKDYRFSAVVTAIVLSEPFRKKRGG